MTVISFYFIVTTTWKLQGRIWLVQKCYIFCAHYFFTNNLRGSKQTINIFLSYSAAQWTTIFLNSVNAVSTQRLRSIAAISVFVFDELDVRRYIIILRSAINNKTMARDEAAVVGENIFFFCFFRAMSINLAW